MATKPDNAVVLICDRNFLPPALFVIEQLLDQRAGAFDIILQIVGSGGDADLPSTLAPQILLQHISIDPALVTAAGPTARSGAAYGRLQLGSFAGIYNRVLYLDSDIWIAGKHIAPVFETDLRGHALAAVRDTAEVMHAGDAAWARYKAQIGMKRETPYFNSGVLLIDPALFSDRRIGERTGGYVMAHDEMGPFHDQTALNATLDGDWLEICPRWNWSFTLRPQILATWRPHIIHFVGKYKPWNDRAGRFEPHYAAALGAYCRAIGYPDFVTSADPWQSLRRRITRRISEIGDRFGEGRKARTVRRYIESRGFADD